MPSSALHVIASEELERDPASTLRSVLEFLGLQTDLATAPQLAKLVAAADAAASPTDPPVPKYYCANGKRGVLDGSPLSRAWRSHVLDGSSDEDGDGGEGIGECPDLKDKVVGRDGVARYAIEKSTAQLLGRFFRPYNQRLFSLVGRPLPWGLQAA